MNSRLQQFLEIENLSPAKLADILGVQRSGLSHILSGRNKPGFDFINKLLLKFPSISADWLITGKGKPYKDLNDTKTVANNSNFSNDSSAIISSDDLFSRNSDIEDDIELIQNTNREHINTKDNPSQLNENLIKSSGLDQASKKRLVKRVIIFYNDGSFEEMFPSGNLFSK